MRIKRGMIGMAALLGLAASAGSAQAEPITFTFSYTASGTLGGAAFTDSLITLTATGDTDDATTIGDFVEIRGITGATVEITGLGVTAAFTIPMDVEVNPTLGVVYFARSLPLGSTIDGVSNPALVGYRLDSPLGPLSGGPAGGGFIRVAIPTTAGDLIFSTFPGESTFTAVVQSAPAVPEPSSLALAGCGAILAVAAFSLRRRLA